MDEMISCIIKRPGENPVAAVVQNTLKAYQDIVEGYIETVDLGHGILCICNEEGLIRGMPHNIAQFYGPLCFVGYTTGEEDFRSLEPEDAEFLLELLREVE